jgi:hypothetical protein
MASADMSKTLCEVFSAHHEAGVFTDYCRLVETGEPWFTALAFSVVIHL